MFYSGQGFQLGGSSEAKTLSHPSSDDLKTGDSSLIYFCSGPQYPQYYQIWLCTKINHNEKEQTTSRCWCWWQEQLGFLLGKPNIPGGDHHPGKPNILGLWESLFCLRQFTCRKLRCLRFLLHKVGWVDNSRCSRIDQSLRIDQSSRCRKHLSWHHPTTSPCSRVPSFHPAGWNKETKGCCGKHHHQHHLLHCVRVELAQVDQADVGRVFGHLCIIDAHLLPLLEVLCIEDEGVEGGGKRKQAETPNYQQSNLASCYWWWWWWCNSDAQTSVIGCETSNHQQTHLAITQLLSGIGFGNQPKLFWVFQVSVPIIARKQENMFPYLEKSQVKSSSNLFAGGLTPTTRCG